MTHNELMAQRAEEASKITVSAQDGRLGATAGQKKDKPYLPLTGGGAEGEGGEVEEKALEPALDGWVTKNFSCLLHVYK